LDAAGYSIDQKALKDKLPNPKEAASMLLQEEVWRQTLSSLVVCFFARNIYDKNTVIKALETAGHRVTSDRLDRMGLEILREKNQFKLDHGFDPRSLRIPRRILEIDSPHGELKEKYLKDSIEKFYQLLVSD
jgi:aldehyde:ferredoxin oxidoreductase